jgi:hypothetical protein
MRRRPRSKRSGSTRGFKALAASAWLLCMCATSRVFAQQPPAPFTVAEGVCPDAAAVESAALDLVPPERHELLRRGIHVALEDLGDTYTVSVSKNDEPVHKSYADPARDCAARARFAAVFVVLTVFPPELDLAAAPAPPTPTPPPPTRSKAPPAIAAPPPALHVELSALYAVAPAIFKAPALTTFGVELRLVLGRGLLRSTLAAAYTSPSSFELDDVHGDLRRLPASAGLRLHSERNSWALDGDLGALAVLERVRPTNLAESRTLRAIELGARAGLSVTRSPNRRFAPFFSAFVWFVPGPGQLSVLPQGQFGNLPYLWIGAAAGVSFGL